MKITCSCGASFECDERNFGGCDMFLESHKKCAGKQQKVRLSSALEETVYDLIKQWHEECEAKCNVCENELQSLQKEQEEVDALEAELLSTLDNILVSLKLPDGARIVGSHDLGVIKKYLEVKGR